MELSTTLGGTFDGGKINVQYDNPGQLPTIVPPGTVVQVRYFQTGELVGGTAASPDDDTIPQISEGNEVMALGFTPKFASSLLKIEVTAWCGPATAPRNMTLALFLTGQNDALAAVYESIQVATGMQSIGFNHMLLAGDASAKEFTARLGLQVAEACYINGYGSRVLGGVGASSIIITEIAQ
jgi:hypothetical protein